MVRFFNIAELIVIVVAASLFAAALVGWLHKHNIYVLWRALGFLHRPLGEVFLVLICIGGLVHYGATKGFLGRPMMMAPRELQQELLSEPETSADFAGMFPPYTNVVTNVCATGIGVTETSVVLRTHWSLDDYFAGMGVEVYATDELLSNSWFGVGTASIGSDEGSAIIELPHSLLPGGLSSSMFFTIGSNIDTDRDGLSDFFEGLITKTDPHSIDSDRDGMPDGWEYSNELDPASSEGDDGTNGDPDGDGQSNLSEYMAGSNPKDASSSGYNPPGETIEIPLSVGSDAAAWDLEIAGNGPTDTSVRHLVMDTDLVWITNRMSFCKGNSYTITLHWRHNDRLKNAGNRKCPWYCWELQANGFPTNAMYREDSAIRLNTHDYIVGENYIIDNREGLFTKEVHEASLDGGTNVAERLKAFLHVYKCEVSICDPDDAAWSEIDASRVLLDDENLRIKIKIFPAIPTLALCQLAMGSNVVVSTSGTCPSGIGIPIAGAEFALYDAYSEIRITKTRAQLISLGLLPSQNEDGVDEMSWVDIVQTAGQSIADSEAFSSLGYAFRGKATLDKTKDLDSSPPNSQPSHSYMNAGGCEILTAMCGGAESNKRQIMNQSDVFYYSGHGNGATGGINRGFTPNLLGDYWKRDLNCVVIAGCSVMNIAGHRIKSFGITTRFKRWYRNQQDRSVGTQWEDAADVVFLGYCYTAPLDSQGAVSIASEFASKVKDGMNFLQAWKEANDKNAGRNACAIDCTTTPHEFWYWDETSGSPVWTQITKGTESW